MITHLSLGFDIPAGTPSTVTVEMPLEAAANAAVAIKQRMHELQDQIDEGMNVGIDIMRTYAVALNALNAQLPGSLQNHWIRSELA